MAPAEEGEEEELPVDVPYVKLVDWLIERKQLPATWQDALKAVRGQLDAALRELPEEVAEIGSLIKGKRQQLHYQHCKRIMELLEGAQEGRVRNFFGSYTTPLLRAWAGVLRSYERDNVYLGEAARLLVQNGVYTCPGLRRTIAQLEKQIGDSSRKMAECERTAQELERRFRLACQELQVPLPAVTDDSAGDTGTAAYDAMDFRAALLVRTAELPALFEEVESLAAADAVGEALTYYGDVGRFLRHAHMEGGKDDGDGDDDGHAFPILRRVRAGERGGGGAGHREDEATGLLEIDWEAAMAGDAAGAGGGGVEAEAGGIMVGDIDWGGGEGESAVDWGKEQQQQQGQHGAVEAAAADIDWAIEVEEAGADAAAEEASPHPAAAGASSGSAGVGMAGGGSLLADPGLRSELLNDLLELRAFLAQRHMELAAEEAEGGGVAFVGQYQGAHAGLQRQSLGAVDKHLEAVNAVLGKLRSPRLQSLLMIQASSAYLDRVVAGLRQKLEHILKMRGVKAAAEARREAAIAELGKAVPEYEATASATRALKAQTEEALTTLFKGRRVHIIGDINTL